MSIFKKTPEEKIQHKINSIVLQAREAGLPSFMLLFNDSDSVPAKSTFHYEKISTSEAINLSGNCWLKLIQIETETHPEYKPEYKKIYTDATADFMKLVKRVNTRVAAFNKKNTPKK